MKGLEFLGEAGDGLCRAAFSPYGIDVSIFLAGFHETRLTGPINVSPVSEVRILGGSVILGIQAHVANHVVKVAVVVKVAMSNRGPPSQTLCRSGFPGTIDQFPFLVFPKLDGSPFRGHNEINPPVGIVITP